jgi:hypothetical protein
MTRLLLCTAMILTLTASANAHDCYYREVPCTVNTPTGPVRLLHHRDGKTTSYTTADGKGTLISAKCGKYYCTYENGRLLFRMPRTK